MNSIELHIEPEDLAEIMGWTMLHESQFLSRVYERWPHLRKLVPGTEVKLVVYKFGRGSQAGTGDKLK